MWKRTGNRKMGSWTSSSCLSREKKGNQNQKLLFIFLAWKTNCMWWVSPLLPRWKPLSHLTGWNTNNRVRSTLYFKDFKNIVYDSGGGMLCIRTILPHSPCPYLNYLFTSFRTFTKQDTCRWQWHILKFYILVDQLFHSAWIHKNKGPFLIFASQNP